MSIANSFGFEGKATRATKTLAVTRAARDHLTLTKPERAAPLQSARDRLDGLEVYRGRLAVDAMPDVVGQPLANHWCDLLVPQDRTHLEADWVAGDFWIDFAATERGVERFDGAKIFHRGAPSLAADQNGACGLKDDEDGRRSD